jgi:hypothetical protein
VVGGTDVSRAVGRGFRRVRSRHVNHFQSRLSIRVEPEHEYSISHGYTHDHASCAKECVLPATTFEHKINEFLSALIVGAIFPVGSDRNTVTRMMVVDYSSSLVDATSQQCVVDAFMHVVEVRRELMCGHAVEPCVDVLRLCCVLLSEIADDNLRAGW